ncbi:MAG TPA: Trp family transcriptional regulator [Chloroflexota bacterium]|jgi:uncharacterized protein YerC
MPRQVEPELHDNERVQALCAAVAACKSDHELLLRFLRDLLSARELQDFANRWAAARMLMDGRTQIATAKELGRSTKTVNEVAMWVSGPFATGGYDDAYRRVSRGYARQQTARR